MAEHVFESPMVEEFYNSCHNRSDGRFCGVKARGKKIQRVPMSESARRSNAILRRLASDRKSKGYQKTKHVIAGLKGNETKAIKKAQIRYKNENNAGNEQRTSKEVLDLTRRFGGRSRG